MKANIAMYPSGRLCFFDACQMLISTAGSFSDACFSLMRETFAMNGTHYRIFDYQDSDFDSVHRFKVIVE